MLDNLLTNKYFCIAIVIALVLILYMYHTKQSCNIEGMSNVDLTPLAQELTKKPWAEQKNTSSYELVGPNEFNNNVDKYVKQKLKKNGYKYMTPLERKDQIYEQSKNLKKKKHTIKKDPVPLDNHPELSQCQPCKCELTDTDSDSDSDYNSNSDIYDSNSE